MRSSDKAHFNLWCQNMSWDSGTLEYCWLTKINQNCRGYKTSNITEVDCSVCTEGRFANYRNRKTWCQSQCACWISHTDSVELHTDFAGLIGPTAQDGFKYAILFTEDFSGTVSAYFLKNKSDTTLATKQLLADGASYGTQVYQNRQWHRMHRIQALFLSHF